MAVIESLERDTVRLRSAYATVNRNPLGACAITGTGFPIDRDRTSDLLGFSGPTGNTYGSIGAVDYLLEPLSAASVLVIGLGRFTQDLLLWATVEIGYLRLPDGFVQVSSIMPQKRNPVALEHARALFSKALGELGAVAQVPHNTPFGDIVDTEDDLQPLVRGAFRDATRAVSLLAATMAKAEFDVARMRERAGAAWVTVTELADVLVRDHGLSFGEAHEIVSDVVRRGRDGAQRRQRRAGGAPRGRRPGAWAPHRIRGGRSRPHPQPRKLCRSAPDARGTVAAGGRCRPRGRAEESRDGQRAVGRLARGARRCRSAASYNVTR